MKTDLYAFYGSLRQGEYNNEYLMKEKEGVEYISTEQVAGYTLHSLGSYPVILKGTEENKITVDVFRITNEKVSSRIRNMELGAGYEEQLIPVEGYPEKVAIYVGGRYHEEYKNRYPIVPNGDWVTRK